MTVSAAQLRDRQRLNSVYLYEITLSNSGPTVYFSDRNINVAGQWYEAYIVNFPDIEEAVSRRDSTFLNSDITIEFDNGPFMTYDHLSEIGEVFPFEGSSLVIKELLVSDSGEQATPEVVYTGVLDSPSGIGLLRFRCDVSSMLSDKFNKFEQTAIEKDDFPTADQDSLGKVANIIYGTVEGVKCHSIAGGAKSTLTADITSTTSTINLVDASDFPSSGAFTIKIDNEEIRISSRTDNALTVNTRGYNGTQSGNHGVGGLAYEIPTEYLFLVADHPVKAVNTVYFGQTVQSTGLTKYTGQSGDEHSSYPGMAVIKSTVKPAGLTFKAGTDSSETEMIFLDTIDASGGTYANLNNLIDGNLNSVGTQTSDVYTTITLSKAETIKRDAVINSVFLCIRGVHAGAAAADLDVTWNGATITESGWNDDSPYVTTKAKATSIGAGDWSKLNDAITITCRWVYIAEVYLEVTYTKKDSQVKTEVYADVEGYKDPDGTFGGTGNLIQRPDWVLKHFLITRFGFAVANLELSFFTSAGTAFASAISGGYKFAFCIDEKINAFRFVQRMASECRSVLYFSKNRFYLYYLPDTAPASLKTISKSGLMGKNSDFVFDKTLVRDIKNDLTAKFKKNYFKANSDAQWLGTSKAQSLIVVDTVENVRNGALTEYAEDIAQNGGFAYEENITNGGFAFTNKITTGDFTPVENVTNGGFTGSASGWTLNSPWYYDSNDIKKPGPDSTATVTQDFATVPGRSYTVIYQIINRSSGNIYASLGGVNLTTRSSDNTYKESLVAVNDNMLSFNPNAVARLKLDNISVIHCPGWDIGSDWIFNSNKVKKTGSGTSIISQDFGIIAGRAYKLTWTYSNGGGTNITPSIGGTNGTTRNSNGTYSETIIAGNTDPLKFTPDSGTSTEIDNVSCETVEAWTIGTGWSFDGSAALKNADGTGTLAQAMTIEAGKTYLVTYDILNWTVGTVTPSIGGVNLTARGANGTYQETILAVSTDSLAFTPTNTARFSIDNVSVQSIESWLIGEGWSLDAGAAAKDSDGTGTLSQDMGISIGDYLTVTYTISNWTVGTVTPSIGGVNLTTRGANGTFVESVVAVSTDPLAFTPTNTARFSIDDVKVEDDWYYSPGWENTGTLAAHNTSGSGSLKQLFAVTAGREYTVTFTVSGWSSGEGVYFTLGGVTGTTRSADGTFIEVIVAVNTNPLQFFTLNAADNISIDDISVTHTDILASSEARYGKRPDISIEFHCIRLQAMADHVLAFKLILFKDTFLVCRGRVAWENFDIYVGDTFDISNDLHNAVKFFIENFRRIGKAEAEIRAIQWY